MDDPANSEGPGNFMRIMQKAMPKMTPWHVRLYRLLGGRFVGTASGGAPVVLLTTTGRRTGEPRTVVLGHVREGDDLVVVGSNGGLPALPAWVLNLRADPRCEVELGSERFEAEAEFLEGDEWERVWSRLESKYPVYDQARRWAGRDIPLVRLSTGKAPGGS